MKTIPVWVFVLAITFGVVGVCSTVGGLPISDDLLFLVSSSKDAEESKIIPKVVSALI